jgi:penicillin amidase
LAELIGPSGIAIDRFIRTSGLPRAAKKTIQTFDDFNRVFVENYCAGVNKAASSVVVYPAEFYLTMTKFEEYTPEDTATLFIFMMQFLTKDWHQEFLRERLTEIYDRELVDKLLPF